MQNFPSNFSWVLAENCSCPIADNYCYRPELYSKPLICAYKNINNILKFIQQPFEKEQPSCSFYFLCFSVAWIVEHYLSGHNGKQRRRQQEQRIFAPDLRASTRRIRRPINRNDIGPPLPLHCRVTKEKVDVHHIGMKDIGGKENVKGNEKEEVEVKV
uniref:Uncharacterized protein n=1 Tax=Meloidogyne hapla TaxID=6305 RepID=A0A1I8BXZ0_MELHA